ncbi:lipoprotein, putative, partial [Vibrio cholerae O1 str. EC-0027]
IVMLMVG